MHSPACSRKHAVELVQRVPAGARVVEERSCPYRGTTHASTARAAARTRRSAPARGAAGTASRRRSRRRCSRGARVRARRRLELQEHSLLKVREDKRAHAAHVRRVRRHRPPPRAHGARVEAGALDGAVADALAQRVHGERAGRRLEVHRPLMAQGVEADFDERVLAADRAVVARPAGLARARAARGVARAVARALVRTRRARRERRPAAERAAATASSRAPRSPARSGTQTPGGR